jgi:hypothetical protein
MDTSMLKSKSMRNVLRFNRTSAWLMSSFVLLIGIILYVWWPLAEEYLATFDPDFPWWAQVDWLLIGIFLVMSLLIMSHADLRHDLPIVLVGAAGGLVIEAWGTQTLLWTYYTNERPPLWIIPAWPIASLAIDRIYRFLRYICRHVTDSVMMWVFRVVYMGFYVIMLLYTAPTLDRSLTVLSLLLCAFLILTTRNARAMLLAFIAGTALGYFLELWGTTRLCWTYYSLETPPLFSVLAHGMAAAAFFRAADLFPVFLPILSARKRSLAEPE